MDSIDPDDADTLALFAEKFGKMRRSTVWRAFEEDRVRFSFSANRDEPLRIRAEGPSEEAVDAFVLTLRFFLQNNERISIANMSALVERLPIEGETKACVAQGRAHFNAFLSRPCGIKIDGLHPTNREVLDIFLYGGLAHANPEKREVLIRWATQPLIIGMMRQVFFSSVLTVLQFLGFIDANLRASLGSDSASTGTTDDWTAETAPPPDG